MKSDIKNARKQIGFAKMRLKWIKQQLSTLFAECAVSSTEISTSHYLETQTITSKKSSRSNRLKDLKSDRSDRSTLRSNAKSDKNKKRASTNSALNPIYSSKISKAAGKKTPRPQRPSKIPAERDDDQNQNFNITISSSPPANVAPRRSRRLSINQKKSDTLKADLTADLERNVQPQFIEIMLRRNDRVSKQKKKINTSTSNATLSSIVIWQTIPFPRSKHKNRVANIKSNRS